MGEKGHFNANYKALGVIPVGLISYETANVRLLKRECSICDRVSRIGTDLFSSL